jgi:D-amino-acid dehydrogenase
MHVLVIGAGVIGLATAYHLHRAGHAVTVLERETAPGLGTSHANGALLHPSLCAPWNAPGTLARLWRSLGDEASPLLLRPRALPGLLSWGWQFLRESRPERFAAHAADNLRLARHSMACMRALREHTGLRYHAYFSGSLSVFRAEASLRQAQADAQVSGVQHTRLDRAGLLAAEPALAAVAAQLVGGLHFPEDEAGDAHAFCEALAAWLVGQGVQLHLGTAVQGLQADGSRIVAVQAQPGRTASTASSPPALQLAPDAVVLCGGVWSGALLRPLSLRLPVQPVKGYSITLPNPPATGPRRALVDHDLHAAVVPVAGHLLRVAGTAEFAGWDARVQPARIANLRRLLASIYPAVAAGAPESTQRPWAGFRPMTPDGVPLIGVTRWRNLYVNAGHGHLGWTLAAGSGDVLARLLDGRPVPLAAAPYRPDRFALGSARSA